jgi:hypothetical protein
MGKDMEGSVMTQFKVLYRHLPGETEGKYANLIEVRFSVRELKREPLDDYISGAFLEV